MPTMEENLQLCYQLLLQKAPDGKLDGVDWDVIASKLGLDNKAGARMRWTRLQKQLSENDGLIPAKATPAKKAATPKKPKAAKDLNATPTKRTPKKRKVEEVAEEDEEMKEVAADNGTEVDAEENEENEENDG